MKLKITDIKRSKQISSKLLSVVQSGQNAQTKHYGNREPPAITVSGVSHELMVEYMIMNRLHKTRTGRRTGTSNKSHFCIVKISYSKT